MASPGSVRDDKTNAVTLANTERIPAELRHRPQWVGWRYEQRGDRLTKVPVDPRRGRPASSTNTSTWGTFEDARDSCNARGSDGIGYVFAAADPYCGIDLDHCRLGDGTIEPDAQAIIDRLASYSEWSPSGGGVHIIAKGKLPAGGRHRKGRVEIYDRGRYFTVTGDHVDGTPSTIEERQGELEALHAELFGPPQEAPTANNNGSQARVPVRFDDARLIEKAQAAKNGAAFAKLWSGEWSGYPSQSEADLALCAHLAFWTRDTRQIDRLVRASGLYRLKWDSTRGGETYGQRTIDKALSAAMSAYNPTRTGAPTRPSWAAPSDPGVEQQADDDARRSAPLAWLQRQAVLQQLPLSGARKLGRKRGQYELLLRDGGAIELGGAADVLTPRAVQAAIADATGIAIPELKRAAWRPIAEAIFAVAGTGEDIGADPEAEARVWLETFTADYPYGNGASTINPEDSSALAETLRALAFSEGYGASGFFWTSPQRELVVHAPAFVRFVTGPRCGARTSHADARLRLRRLGFRPVQMSARDDEGVAKARVWRSPAGFDPSE